MSQLEMILKSEFMNSEKRITPTFRYFSRLTGYKDFMPTPLSFSFTSHKVQPRINDSKSASRNTRLTMSNTVIFRNQYDCVNKSLPW